MHKVLVLIPCYNEEKNILRCLSNIITLNDKRIEKILLIDDGSTDKTMKIASKFKKVLIHKHSSNRGLGAAVRTGLNLAKNFKIDLVVKIDADCQHDPKDIFEIIKPITNEKYDLVYGNRKKKIKYKMPTLRRLGNICFSKLMKFLTGWQIEDSQPGIFAIRKICIKDLKIFGDYNYTQQVLLSSYYAGLKFKQIDVTFFKRFEGNSFVSLKYIYLALTQILTLLIYFRPLKTFGKIGIFLLSLALLISSIQFFSWMLGYSEKIIENVNLIIGLTIVGGQSLLAGLLGELIVNLNKDQNDK